MKSSVAIAIKNHIMGTTHLLEADIKNCPDWLWDKNAGGDPYWQHIYHALTGIYAMMPIGQSRGKPAESAIPDEYAMLKAKTPYKGEHSKELMLNYLEQAREHISHYFGGIDDSMLENEIDFFGKSVPLLDVLMMNDSHIMYHIGICDSALRENGLAGAM